MVFQTPLGSHNLLYWGSAETLLSTGINKSPLFLHLKRAADPFPGQTLFSALGELHMSESEGNLPSWRQWSEKSNIVPSAFVPLSLHTVAEWPTDNENLTMSILSLKLLEGSSLCTGRKLVILACHLRCLVICPPPPKSICHLPHPGCISRQTCHACCILKNCIIQENGLWTIKPWALFCIFLICSCFSFNHRIWHVIH